MVMKVSLTVQLDYKPWKLPLLEGGALVPISMHVGGSLGRYLKFERPQAMCAHPLEHRQLVAPREVFLHVQLWWDLRMHAATSAEEMDFLRPLRWCCEAERNYMDVHHVEHTSFAGSLLLFQGSNNLVREIIVTVRVLVKIEEVRLHEGAVIRRGCLR